MSCMTSVLALSQPPPTTPTLLPPQITDSLLYLTSDCQTRFILSSLYYSISVFLVDFYNFFSTLMMSYDLADFLTAWDLSQYIETFRVNDIDMKTLPCLTENMIKELIPVISHRARFLSNLEQWKLIIQGSMPSVIRLWIAVYYYCSKYNIIKSEFNLSTDEPLIRISWAELKGTRYKVNSILTKDLDDDNPQFVSIKDIFMYGSDKIIFECKLLNTDSLISPIPNTMNVTPDGVRYVTVRDPL